MFFFSVIQYDLILTCNMICIIQIKCAADQLAGRMTSHQRNTVKPLRKCSRIFKIFPLTLVTVYYKDMQLV